jgi:hemoglobin
MRVRMLPAVLVLIGIGSLVRADDKPVLDKPLPPIDRADVDRRVIGAVYEVELLGTEIFNKGGWGECYRLYNGALLGLKPFLDNRKVLLDKVQMRLDRAAKMKPADAAFELRTALDEIQTEIAPPKTSTLWERLGSEPVVRKIVDDIVLKVADDKKANFFRDGKYKPDGKALQHLKQMLVEYISENTNGPLKYQGKSMAEAHKGLGITDAEFDAMKADIVEVLKTYKVSEADLETLGKFIEGTRKDIVEKK